MKKLSLNEMEQTEGGAQVDCLFMVLGFAGAVAASSTGIGILFGAISFAGGVRSAMACSDRSTFWYGAPSTGHISTASISGSSLLSGTGRGGSTYSGPLVTRMPF